MSIKQYANDASVQKLTDLINELQRAKIALGDVPVSIQVDAANKWNVKLRIDKANGRVLLLAGDHA